MTFDGNAKLKFALPGKKNIDPPDSSCGQDRDSGRFMKEAIGVFSNSVAQTVLMRSATACMS